jgi:hypothetical protein
MTPSETATIYYTTNGTTPTESSASGTTVKIKPGQTLKFFAKDSAGNSSSVQSQPYGFPKRCK